MDEVEASRCYSVLFWSVLFCSACTERFGVVHLPTDESLTDWLTTDWLTTEWLTDWLLTDWLTNYSLPLTTTHYHSLPLTTTHHHTVYDARVQATVATMTSKVDNSIGDSQRDDSSKSSKSSRTSKSSKGKSTRDQQVKELFTMFLRKSLALRIGKNLDQILSAAIEYESSDDEDEEEVEVGQSSGGTAKPSWRAIKRKALKHHHRSAVGTCVLLFHPYNY